MEDGTVEVYCDGSVTDAIWTDFYTSARGADFIARAIVLVPDIDVGLIQQTRRGMVTERGTPDSIAAEAFAVSTALSVCRKLDILNYVVLSDCQGAVHKFRHVRVEWRSRDQMRLPNDFFDKVLRRAAYLRASHEKVINRRSHQTHQREAFELFNASNRTFTLSASPLWLRVLNDAEAHPETLGSFPSH